MLIAIASDDEKTISHHFGRASGFVVIDVRNGKEESRSYRKNIGRNSGECGSCDHAAMIRNIKDCGYVISHGMGRRIFEDLSGSGIKAIVTDEESVDVAVAGFMKNSLESHEERLH
jgi:predicted Fe-Mo cluster-binding NifX family protein